MNGDGHADESSQFEYDLRGYLVLEEHDRNGDGVIDERIRYVYDEHGNAVVTERVVDRRTWRQEANYDCVAEIIKKAPRRKIRETVNKFAEKRAEQGFERIRRRTMPSSERLLRHEVEFGRSGPTAETRPGFRRLQ